MKRLLLIATLLFPTLAIAQNPVLTNPGKRTINSNASGSIAVTNTFQSVFVSNDNRSGCVIQNKGTNVMYIFFGATASATTATAGRIAAGSAAYCIMFGTVLTPQVSITGTSGDLFYAVQY